jgi:hypothetical protein
LGCYATGDDCTNDCNSAINTVSQNIQKTVFQNSLVSAFESIFENAPNTKLFVTGYPQFFNDQTTQCNGITFMGSCSAKHLVLPLTQARRTVINGLTLLLNQVLQTAISSSAHSSQIAYVDTDPFFEGHRFCEEGVDEPSYNNPDIWFFPWQYWTGSITETNLLSANDVQTGDCDALYNESADWDTYIACEIGNAILGGATFNLNNQTNNVPGEGAVNITGSLLPASISRVFHPSINGHQAYANAIESAYNNAAAGRDGTPQAVPMPAPLAYQPGTCSFHLTEFQTCGNVSDNLYASIKLLDNGKNVIGTTALVNNDMGPSINDADPFSMDRLLPYPLVVTGEHEGDYIQFSYDGLAWKSTDSNGAGNCKQGGWDSSYSSCEQFREMDCSFPC